MRRPTCFRSDSRQRTMSATALGSGGAEMCLQLLSLDRDLGSFFNVLDAEGIDYSVVLTADHGGMDIPERLRAKGVVNATRADPALGTVGRRQGDRRQAQAFRARAAGRSRE